VSARINIHFGALSKPLYAQLGWVETPALERLESLKYSLALLHVNGILADRENQKAERRLMKRIIAYVRERQKGDS
jgi:hypothetical protein